jgi:hypothetical protein
MGGNLPLQSLERANFTPDSDDKESTRYVTLQEKEENHLNDEIMHTELMCALADIKKELKKINTYFALITDSRL